MLRRLKAWPLILLGIVVFQLLYQSQREEGDVSPPTITSGSRAGGSQAGGSPAEISPEASSPAGDANEDASARRYAEGERQVLHAFAARQSEVVVEIEGTVTRLLADDLEGSRHQKFIVELSGGHTVLVSHNIDLAHRIDALRAGDTVQIRGQYEWNDRGGVVHWTHHDPRNRRPGGWIRHRGNEYR